MGLAHRSHHTGGTCTALGPCQLCQALLGPERRGPPVCLAGQGAERRLSWDVVHKLPTGAFLPSWQSKEEPQPRGAAMAGEEEAPCSRLGHPVCGRGGERNLGGLPPGFWQEALRARACRPALLRTPGPCLPGSGAS